MRPIDESRDVRLDQAERGPAVLAAHRNCAQRANPSICRLERHVARNVFIVGALGSSSFSGWSSIGLDWTRFTIRTTREGFVDTHYRGDWPATPEQLRCLLLRGVRLDKGITGYEAEKLIARYCIGWRSLAATRGQEVFLRGYGHWHHDLTRGEASDIIDALKSGRLQPIPQDFELRPRFSAARPEESGGTTTTETVAKCNRSGPRGGPEQVRETLS